MKTRKRWLTIYVVILSFALFAAAPAVAGLLPTQGPAGRSQEAGVALTVLPLLTRTRLPTVHAVTPTRPSLSDALTLGAPKLPEHPIPLILTRPGPVPPIQELPESWPQELPPH